MELGYKKAVGIYYENELRVIKKKAGVFLQPLFEAFINSLESIFYRNNNDKTLNDNGEITINLHLSQNKIQKDVNQFDFVKLSISDTGVGFNDKEFDRFINLRDDRKGYMNKGTGRIQFCHFFDMTEISSIFKDDKSLTGFSKIEFSFSKNYAFLMNNSLVKVIAYEKTEDDKPFTILTFKSVLDNNERTKYSELNNDIIKSEIINYYLAGFCEIRDRLPQITIKTFVNDLESATTLISSADIPKPHKEKDGIEIKYSKINIQNKIEKCFTSEKFKLLAFLISEKRLKKNEIILVSKGTFARKIDFDKLRNDDIIDGNRYLFLLSGKYIDEKDNDNRGELNILSREEFKKRYKDSCLDIEEILMDDIQETTNQTILTICQEIEEKNIEKKKSIDELEQMFLLNTESINAINVSINDSDETILEKVYKTDAKLIAEQDANLKEQIKQIEALTPNKSDEYQNNIKKIVNDFIKTIPLQNRVSLTRYVARRKIVLDLFQKLLDKEIEKVRNGGNIDEDIMHNLIFQKSSSNTEESDLWLINEEYIYFQGFSETPLKSIMFDGEYMFRNVEELSAEEEEFRLYENGDKYKKRPDILLFPKEEKCIIIELKAPDKDVSVHLSQINRYATLINNYSKDNFRFKTFYGYLIGENIDLKTIRYNDADFKQAANFDYLVKPHKAIADLFNRGEGSLYTEIIKYSTLLERAKIRNKIFIDKLLSNK